MTLKDDDCRAYTHTPCSATGPAASNELRHLLRVAVGRAFELKDIATQLHAALRRSARIKTYDVEPSVRFALATARLSNFKKPARPDLTTAEQYLPRNSSKAVGFTT